MNVFIVNYTTRHGSGSIPFREWQNAKDWCDEDFSNGSEEDEKLEWLDENTAHVEDFDYSIEKWVV